MANEGLDELMARMARSKVNRRSFLAAAGLIGGSAVLAACSPSGSASSAPSVAGVATFPPAGPIEEELFMYNWSDYVAPANMEAFKAELWRMSDERVIQLHVLNEVREAKDPELAIHRNDRLYYFVRWN